MVLFGMRFVETTENIKKYADLIRANSEKHGANVMFNVKVFVPEHDVIMVWKEFIALKTMLMGIGIVALLSLFPAFIWQVYAPLFVMCGLFVVIMMIESQEFNFILMRAMVKRAGYKGKVRML